MNAEVNKMKPLKKTVSISLDDPILEQVRYLAEYEDRSLSSYINQVLKAHLERLKQDPKCPLNSKP